MNIIILVHYLNHLHAFTSPNKSTIQNISRNSAVQISKGLLYKKLMSSFLRLKNSMIRTITLLFRRVNVNKQCLREGGGNKEEGMDGEEELTGC